MLNLSSLLCKLDELEKFCPDRKIVSICEQLLTSSLWDSSRMNHFSLSDWEKLYDHDLMTNLIEKKNGKEFLFGHYKSTPT